MALKNKIEKDFKEALKAKDELKVSCLRMVKSAITAKETEGSRKELDDAGIISVISSIAKRSKESIEQFEKGGRKDLADKEKAELEFFKTYLPKELDQSELVKLVEEAIQESGAADPSEMGKVMKILMAKVQGKADGKVVSALVQEKLKTKK